MGWTNDGVTSLTIPTGATSTQPRVVIGADIPAELAAYYLAQTPPTTVVEATLYYSNNGTDYGYQALAVRGNVLVLAQGATYSGTVHETSRLDITSGFTANTFFEANKLTLLDSALTTAVLGAAQNSDNNADRLQILVSGAIKAGPGGTNVPLDTTLYRGGVAQWASDPIVANVAGTPETWHALTLQNSYVSQGGSFPTPSYRLVAAPANSVEIVGSISGGTTHADNTLIATLPVGYRPLHTVTCTAWCSVTTAGGESPAIDLSSDGTLRIFGCGSATINFHCFFPLDV